MIRNWGLLDDNARDISYWNNRSDFAFERDIKATRYFYIDAIHNIRYSDNEINATINIEGMGEFNVKKELLFGRAGAFGCEYTPIISISQPAGNYYIDTATEFEMYCLVYDRKGRLLPEEERAKCKFQWSYYGTKYKPVDNREHQNYEGFIGNVIRGRIIRPHPFVVEVTVSGAAEYDITVRRGIMVSDNARFMQTHDIICPDRVEFRSDGQAPIYSSNIFEVQEIVNGEIEFEDGTRYDYQNELIYPTWEINQTKVLTLHKKEGEYPVFTLPNGKQISKDTNTTYALGLSAQQLNTHVADPAAYAQQWTEDLLSEEYFTYIYFTWGNATVAQAIAFAQNVYPSSLVNEWDGQSLSLDQENSAVIAKMIAAGTKDQRNRFTGVMMGDWHEKADESLDTPGLYGFNAGQQSFGFKTDGTGFIGPSGEGRIQFDGRNALISNSAQTCYINLNPRRILDFLTPDDNTNSGYIINNQAWDAIGNQSISQYFLYVQTPRKVSTFCDDLEDPTATWAIDWSHHEELLWVDAFMHDDNHDYFLVDPNYGVVTTGGIFARYGRIGKEYPWVISDYGLTQKNNFGRIFLGNPEKNLSSGKLIPNPTYTFQGKEITSYDKEGFEEAIPVPENFFTASFANENNIIQTGIRADGYLYTKFATIGNWYVNDYEFYSTDLSLIPDKDNTVGFRKAYQEATYDIETNTKTGHLLDYINLNSKEQFMSFNHGRLVINGKHGWMGFSKEAQGIEWNTASPSYYNMLINFNSGDVGFGKPIRQSDSEEDTIPYSLISGTNGSAYFSKGQVQIDGDTATIYCGVSKTYQGIFGDTVVETETKVGTLYLAGIQIKGETLDIDDTAGNPTLQYTMPREYQYNESTKQTRGTTYTYLNPKDYGKNWYEHYSDKDTILPFDLSTSGGIVNGETYSNSTGDPEIDSKWVHLLNYSGNFYYADRDNTVPEQITLGGAGVFSVTHKTLNTGFVAYIGEGSSITDDNGKTTTTPPHIAITPTDPATNQGYLYNWNLYGGYARLTGNMDIGGNLCCGQIFMLETPAGSTDDQQEYGLVATQQWVNNALMTEMFPRVAGTNNLAAAALQKAVKGINLANQALSSAVGAAHLNIDPAGSDGSANISISLISIYGKTLQTKYDGTPGADNSNSGDPVALALAEHGHNLTYSITDGRLTASVDLGTTGSDTQSGPDEGQEIFADEGISATCEEGAITISATIAGFTVETDACEIVNIPSSNIDTEDGTLDDSINNLLKLIKDLSEALEDLQEAHDALQEDHDALQTAYNTLKSAYDSHTHTFSASKVSINDYYYSLSGNLTDGYSLSTGSTTRGGTVSGTTDAP